jgi:hypothetical protein
MNATETMTHSIPVPDLPRLRNLVPQLFALVAEIEDAAGGRPCQPSGHIIGTIGELLAADALGLTMAPPNTEKFDAYTADGQGVQVKTTAAGRYVPLKHGDGLLVIALLSKRDGSLEILYFGDAEPLWELAGPLQKGGFRPLSMARLRRFLMDQHARDRFTCPMPLGKGTGRPPLPGEPQPGEEDFLRRYCEFHGIPYSVRRVDSR